MTKEEQDLLLKNLCARLPYGVKFSCKDIKGTWTLTGISKVNDEYICFPGLPKLDVIVPYLRPMSSMTMEEEREYISVGRSMSPDNPSVLVDWLNSHHFDYRYNNQNFDYRGLIPIGLALEAPEDMYK